MFGKFKAFLVTFIAYICIHIVRKPSSVLKSVLHPQQDKFDSQTNEGWSPFNHDVDPFYVSKVGLKVSGSPTSADNGVYKCSHYLKINNLCTRYTSSKTSSVIEKVPLSLCQKFNPDYNDPDGCWMYSTHNNEDKNNSPVFFQFYPGDIPESFTSGDPHIDKKCWRRVNHEGSTEAFKSLRINPNTMDGKILLGLIDSMFLLAYTIGLVLSGYVADRVNVRLFLSFGMVMAGLSSILLGLAYRFNIHSVTYFVLVSVWGGFSQSVAWPSVIAVLGRWFPKEYGRRGLILGIWSSSTTIGNMLGSAISTASVEWGLHGKDWPLGFEIPGLIVISGGALVFLLLEVSPPPGIAAAVTEPLLGDADNQSPAPSMLRAVLIPGVIPFALCLFFAKMGQYALFNWGPYYLQVLGFTSEHAGYLCIFFDVGGLLGGIGAGFASDSLIGAGKRGSAACLFLVISSGVIFLYYHVTWNAGDKTSVNVWMMILVGFWVYGPVNLITTAISADLANHPSLNGDHRLIGTVAGIIDGSGSLGAALQGVVIGIISSSVSWSKVFEYLSVCSLLAAVLLLGVVKKEWQVAA